LPIPSQQPKSHKSNSMQDNNERLPLEVTNTSLKNAQSHIDFENNEAVVVLTHEYAVTNAASKKPVLGAYGASTCVILALYDSKNKIAVLAHIDTVADIKSLSNLLNDLSIENTVAHLFGGCNVLMEGVHISSEDLCTSVVELLQRYDVNIVNSDIARDTSKLPPASLAIDSRSGKIYTPVTPELLIQPSELEDLKERCMNQLLDAWDICSDERDGKEIRSPLKRCYNGLQTKAFLSQSLTLGFLSDNRAEEPKEDQGPETNDQSPRKW
jgi:chemotaxis receptor (MCP) glutamine deamidase CheD